MKTRKFSLERLAVWVAGLLGLGALGMISLLAVRYFGASISVYDEPILLNKDPIISSFIYAFLLGLFCVILTCAFCCKKSISQQILWLLTAVVCFTTAIVCCVWIYQCNAMPYLDPSTVYNAAVSLYEGDGAVLNTPYFWTYPHQYSLVFLITGAFRLTGNTSSAVIGYFNVFFLILVILFGRLIADELFENNAVSVSWLLLCATCLPWLFAITLVYGDYMSWGMLLPALWCAIRFIKSGVLGFGASGACLAALAIAARRNSLIFAVAIVIVLATLVLAESKNRVKRVLVAVAFIVAILIPMPLANQYYTYLTGETAHKGSPPTAHINMGLSESETGPGWYNGYGTDMYEQSGFDDGLAREKGAQELKEKIALMWEQKGETLRFFASKLGTLWTDPSYQSLTITELNKGRSGLPLMVYENQKNYDSVHKFMNAYQELVYVVALGGVSWLLFNKKRKEPQLILLLPLIVFLGGFLFHILWEAKSRYVLSYLPMLMLYAALGLGQLAGWVQGTAYPRAVAWVRAHKAS